MGDDAGVRGDQSRVTTDQGRSRAQLEVLGINFSWWNVSFGDNSRMGSEEIKRQEYSSSSSFVVDPESSRRL